MSGATLADVRVLHPACDWLVRLVTPVDLFLLEVFVELGIRGHESVPRRLAVFGAPRVRPTMDMRIEMAAEPRPMDHGSHSRNASMETPLSEATGTAASVAPASARTACSPVSMAHA
jgi:hypothetical protein